MIFIDNQLIGAATEADDSAREQKRKNQRGPVAVHGAMVVRKAFCVDENLWTHLNKSAKLELGHRMAEAWMAWSKTEKN
jgi:hypothetical protein